MFDPNSAPTGQDIEQAKNVFQRLADAIVQMTDLHRQVQDMQATMNQMRDDLERLRRTNDSLEEALSHSRQARQDLETRNAELARNLDSATMGKLEAENDARHWQELAKTYERERDEARRSADELARNGVSLQTQLEDAKAKLDAIREGYASIFGNVSPEATQSKAEPISHVGEAKQSDPSPTSVDDRPDWMKQARPAPEPVRPSSEEGWGEPQQEQPQAKRRIYEGEPGFDWATVNSPERDDATGKWYIEV